MAEDVLVCPHCGSDGSARDVPAKSGSPIVALGWSGKLLCSNCNYYGFFVSVPRSQLDGAEFPNKDVKLDRKESEKQIYRENNSWLVAVVFITICATILFLLLKM